MSTATIGNTYGHPKGKCPRGNATCTGCAPLGAEVDIDITSPSRAFPETPSVFTDKYDSVNDKVAAFKSEIDTAVAALADDENWLRYLDTASKFHRYSATNQILIYLQTGGRGVRVAGFRAWQDKFGRSVKKGEKAISILAPKIVNVTEKDANDKPIRDANGKIVKRRQIVGFTTASVFDVSQTEGEDLPQIDVELAETPPPGFLEDMEAAANEAGYKVEYRELDSHAKGGPQGWTDPRDKVIVVDSSQTEGSQAATLSHEIGHVYAGHLDNMDKYHIGDGGCRGQFEVEADSIGYVISRANGVQPEQASKLTAQYVAGWSRHDPAALRTSADNISRAAKKILEAVPFRNQVAD